jgi:hypothetical protein
MRHLLHVALRANLTSKRASVTTFPCAHPLLDGVRAAHVAEPVVEAFGCDCTPASASASASAPQAAKKTQADDGTSLPAVPSAASHGDANPSASVTAPAAGSVTVPPPSSQIPTLPTSRSVATMESASSRHDTRGRRKSMELSGPPVSQGDAGEWAHWSSGARAVQVFTVHLLVAFCRVQDQALPLRLAVVTLARTVWCVQSCSGTFAHVTTVFFTNGFPLPGFKTLRLYPDSGPRHFRAA